MRARAAPSLNWCGVVVLKAADTDATENRVSPSLLAALGAAAASSALRLCARQSVFRHDVEV